MGGECGNQFRGWLDIWIVLLGLRLLKHILVVVQYDPGVLIYAVGCAGILVRRQKEWRLLIDIFLARLYYVLPWLRSVLARECCLVLRGDCYFVSPAVCVL